MQESLLELRGPRFEKGLGSASVTGALAAQLIDELPQIGKNLVQTMGFRLKETLLVRRHGLAGCAQAAMISA